MMKKMVAAIVCVITLCLTAVVSFAESARFTDNASVVTDGSADRVCAALDRVSGAHGVNIVITTVDSLNGYEPEEYARKLYHDSFSGDGVILMISMSQRDWAIWATEGKAREAMNEDAREHTADEIMGYLSDNRFGEAFVKYADVVDEMFTLAEQGKPYKKPMSILCIPIALVIGLIAALIGTGSMKAQLKSVAAQRSANNYVKKNSFNVTYSRDIFLYKTLAVHERPKSTSSSGSDDGGSHGKF
ncbi:MAG: TPM domain-containing protein [Oscillospiraceae bacterium]